MAIDHIGIALTSSAWDHAAMPNALEIVELHAEEAAFLWRLRASAVSAPNYGLADLSKLDCRVEAHVDGLRVAADSGWEAAKGDSVWKEPSEVFPAALLAFESSNPARVDVVLRALKAAPEIAPGVISALGWLPSESARPWLEWLCAQPDPTIAALGIRGVAVQRLEPFASLFARVSEPRLRVPLARAAGELCCLPEEVALCRAHLDSDDRELAAWAAWSVVLSGDPSGIPTLTTEAETESPRARHALVLAARAMDAAEARMWHKRLCDAGRLREAVALVGNYGDPESIPWLLDQMAAPKLARIAGESFCLITGVDLVREKLSAEKPDGLELGPSEDPAREDLEVDADEGLRWPHVERIRNWWSARCQEFPPGRRLLCGRPLTRESLVEVLREGTQRQRAAAAIELRRMGSGGALFEVRSPGFRQQRVLGSSVTRVVS